MSKTRPAAFRTRTLRAGLTLAALVATAAAGLGCEMRFDPCARLSKVTAKACGDCISRGGKPNVAERANLDVYRGCS